MEKGGRDNGKDNSDIRHRNIITGDFDFIFTAYVCLSGWIHYVICTFGISVFPKDRT